MTVNWQLRHLVLGGTDASLFDDAVLRSARTERWGRWVLKRRRGSPVLSKLNRRHPQPVERIYNLAECFAQTSFMGDGNATQWRKHRWSAQGRMRQAMVEAALLERWEALLGYARRTPRLDAVADQLVNERALSILKRLKGL